MTNATQRNNRFTEAPAGSTTDALMQRLLNDPDFVIATMVGNSYTAIAKRYQLAMGKAAPRSITALTAELQSMRRNGEKRKVLYIISVPWQYRGDTALDQAVRALRSESVARMTDSTTGAAKNLPTTGFNDMDPRQVGREEEDIEFWTPPGEAAASGTGSNSDFWNSLPGILTGLGGLVGAFTGNAPAAGTGGSNAPAPPKPATDPLKVVLIILAIAAGITAVALIVRAVRKK